jgi:DNA polymerase-1
MSDLSDIRVHLVESWDDAQEFMTWLGKRRPVLAIDLETEGFYWWKQKIRTCQFGDANDGWTIPWDRWSGLVEEVVNVYQGPYVAHNGTFDYKFLEQSGIYLPYDRCHDTYIMAALQNPRRHGGLGLKSLADKHISHAASHGEKMLKAHFKAAKVDWDTVAVDEVTYWAYGALDTIFTARLYEKMLPAMSGMQELYDLERRVGTVLMRMTQRGLRIDTDYVDNQAIQIRTELAEIRADAMTSYGIEKIGSFQPVVDILTADGWIPTVKTPSGKPSLKEEVLETIDHPLAKMRVRHGKLTKLNSNYLSTFQELVHEDRIHCNIRQLGATTGRMSVADPSLQNLPAPRENDPDSKRIRNAFIADEGELLCSIDYDQMELRIAADHSNSTPLIHAFETEPDMHSFMAGMMFKKAPADISGEERSAAKTITFGKLFGQGVKALSLKLGIPQREGSAFMEKYNAAFPELIQYMADLAEEGQRLAKLHKTQPYVYTEFGRYQPTMHRTEYRLTNYRTQGTAADLLKQVIVNLDAAGFGPQMLLPVHDEIVFSFPAHEADDLMAEAIQIMTLDERRVPLTVGGALGTRLGETK